MRVNEVHRLLAHDSAKRSSRSQARRQTSSAPPDASKRDRRIRDLIRERPRFVEDGHEMQLRTGGPADELDELPLRSANGQTADHVKNPRAGLLASKAPSRQRLPRGVHLPQRRRQANALRTQRRGPRSRSASGLRRASDPSYHSLPAIQPASAKRFQTFHRAPSSPSRNRRTSERAASRWNHDQSGPASDTNISSTSPRSSPRIH